MRLIWIYLLTSLLLISCSNTEKARSGSPPNVLFIAVDDLNDWIGVRRLLQFTVKWFISLHHRLVHFDICHAGIL